MNFEKKRKSRRLVTYERFACVCVCMYDTTNTITRIDNHLFKLLRALNLYTEGCVRENESESESLYTFVMVTYFASVFFRISLVLY